MWVPAICPVCHLRYLKRSTNDNICSKCKAKLISTLKTTEKPNTAKPAETTKIIKEPKKPTKRTPKHPTIKKICERCGKKFLSYQPAAKYCSRSCKENAKKTRSRHNLTNVNTMPKPQKEIWPDRSKGPVTDPSKAMPCAYCGTPFIPKSKKSKYCSNRCAERAKNMRKVRVCPSCGIEFRTSSDNTKYCDACAKKFWVRKRR